jgi:hypothetical protein
MLFFSGEKATNCRLAEVYISKEICKLQIHKLKAANHQKIGSANCKSKKLFKSLNFADLRFAELTVFAETMVIPHGQSTPRSSP